MAKRATKPEAAAQDTGEDKKTPEVDESISIEAEALETGAEAPAFEEADWMRDEPEAKVEAIVTVRVKLRRGKAAYTGYYHDGSVVQWRGPSDVHEIPLILFEQWGSHLILAD